MVGDQQLRGELDEHVENMLDLLNQYDITLTAETVEKSREQLARLVSLGSGDPEPVGTVTDLTIPGPSDREDELPLRVYEPEGEGPFPTCVFFHGGGYVLGSVDVYDNVCRLLTNAAEAVVISVDYRLAPEHPWPAGIKDAYAATQWAAGNADEYGGDPERLSVAGDSAGGNFAAVIALMATERGMPDIDRQILVYPSTTYLDPMESRAQNGSGYLIEARDLVWFVKRYVEDEIDAHHKWTFPMNACGRDLEGAPPAYVMTCGYDPLRDEGIAYAERLEAAGVEVEHSNWPTMIHGFLLMDGIVDRTVDGIDEVAEQIRKA